MTALRDYNAAVDFVDRNVAEGRGEKAAFIDPSRNLSYAELRDAAARIGPMLARMGIEQENRIAMVMLDTVDFPILFWGAVRAGIIPVLLNTRLTVDQYRYLLDDSRAKAVFVSTALLPVVLEAAKDVGTLKAVVAVGGAPESIPRLETLLAAENEGAAPARTCADEVAYWLYSSGTTGAPKGVMHVHSSPMTFARLAGQDRIGIRENDILFSAAKLFFAYGIGNANFCALSVGATTVLYPERPTPQTVFETLRSYQPTMLYAVPTLYAAILADPECTPAQGSSRLRLCFSAGEPLPAHVGQAWKERFGLDIVNGVGSSEMGHLYLTNLPHAVEYGTSGVPVKGYDLKLLDEGGREVADGELGELWVRGATAAAGYWNQREKSRRTFQGEWTRTGDKYLRRPDGVYIYTGRADDMFKVSGIWVSPFEVEDALLTHPSVLEAACVPAEDANGLIKPMAFVVLKERGDADRHRALYEELKVHVKRTVGPWKYPRWIEFVDSLPKTATGKIQRYMLRGNRPASEAPDAGPIEQSRPGATRERLRLVESNDRGASA
ncbi:MAG: benzoate-CoA ligase family protein [Hyphomicrobiales bacterium]|nr:benzoate-CoA ligase family protein [Hyphomicrobiales bacterium]